MIISFSVENWKSFKEKTTLSMVGSREQNHDARVPRVRGGKAKVLPAAAIFGGNASGKSNFFGALEFAKNLVVEGGSLNRAMPVEPFLFDTESAKCPSSFVFELAIGEGVYEYSFKVTRAKVLEERLVKIGGKSENVLFSRHGEDFSFGVPQPQKRRLGFVAEGTRDGQLFLVNSVSQKIDTFRNIYDWFNDSLVIISPYSCPASLDQFMDKGQPLNTLLNRALTTLDAGIYNLSGEEIPLGSIPKQIKEYLKEGESLRIPWMQSEGRAIVTRKGGKVQAKKMVTYHAKSGGGRVALEMWQESDGVRRAIDLLLTFLWMASIGSTYVLAVDNLDRSLHTLLTRKLLDSYLSSCSKETRSQLLFTTHDVMLMDQELLRRDEMWVAERDGYGASTLKSLLECEDIRIDTDVRKAYLHGRLGGVPNVLPDSIFGGPCGKGGEGA
jgi:AAA15 family ATPase/GTPase